MDDPTPRARIVYLALADARGHLMRAHLLRQLLAPHGVEVEVVTTSPEGRRFLAALGTPAEVVSSGFGMVFDERHNLRRHRTTTRTLRYLASPWGLRMDRRRLAARSAGAAFVVCDSLHPALLLAPRGQRVVQVYGENIRRATLEHFGPRSSLLGRVHRRMVQRGLHRAFAQLEHTLAAPGSAQRGDRIQLPPIIPRPEPRQTPRERPRAVVYLNPHFRDPAIAEAIEQAIAGRGLSMHAVGEGFTDRAGWSPYDARLVDQVARASVFVTGAGMGGLGMARAFGVPTVCLVTRQPEQRANARQARGDERLTTVLMPTRRPLRRALREAMDQVLETSIDASARDASDAADSIQQLWVSAFLDLLARADPSPRGPTDAHRITTPSLPGARDQQPARRRRLARGREPGPSAGPPS